MGTSVFALGQGWDERDSEEVLSQIDWSAADRVILAELATSVSEAGTSDDGGLLGPIARDDLSELLANLTFSVPVGQIELAEAPYGFHIVKIELRTDDSARSLEEVRDQLRSFLEERKYREELHAFLEEARAESEWCVKQKYQEKLHMTEVDTCEEI